MVTSACLNGLHKLENDPIFQLFDAQRYGQCEAPVEGPTGERTIRCNASRTWMDACNNAGGDVCAMNAKGHGRYTGMDDGEHDYLLYTLLCVPLSCKKDENIRDYIWNITKSWCPTFGFSACTMNVNCNHIPSSKTIPIVFALLGFLTLAGGILTAVYLIYTRYYRASSEPHVETGAPFAAYSELAQYEQDDIDIDDSSLDGVQYEDEAEEDQPLH